MPIIYAAIDPITRIEGHLKINVQIDAVNGVQQVVDAWSIGTLFRGFEKILEQRDPRDAPIITSRICGVCPTAHGLAAAMTLDNTFGVTIPDAALLLRNLVHGACFLESHILHFYLLSLPDYVAGPEMAPWLPGLELSRRLDTRTEKSLLGHYLQAVVMRRLAHEMGAIYGGRLPHSPGFIAGGFTAVSSAENKSAFQAKLTQLTAFIRDVYLPDARLLASLYSDYYTIGKGFGNLISFGTFDLDTAGTNKLLRAGRVVDGQAGVQPVNQAMISEHIKHSWYDDSTNDLPPASGETIARHPKKDAYSWLKSPRYSGGSYECGPLSRMMATGVYTNGVSVMDRHLARAEEALRIVTAMQEWLDALPVGANPYTPAPVPQSASGMGLTEAPRGALGHWLRIENKVISHYQVITPTCWNCSPRDTAGQRGPLEQALVGTPVERADQPVEVLRVVHSMDPCLDCATHVIRPGGQDTVYELWRPSVQRTAQSKEAAHA
ncbi:nickel-dependent hydrogenase large subunit [bacterium]|nr:nickel-dependent hydrogenase large subunit [bacterium]